MLKTLIYLAVIVAVFVVNYHLEMDELLHEWIYIGGGIALLIWVIRFAIISASKAKAKP